jgi:hypothetical protein
MFENRCLTSLSKKFAVLCFQASKLMRMNESMSWSLPSPTAFYWKRTTFNQCPKSMVGEGLLPSELFLLVKEGLEAQEKKLSRN